MGITIRAGDLFAGRYRMTVLLAETDGGRFWRARDEVLARSVALHLIDRADPRADSLMEAARRSARVQDRRLLRVLDADRTEDFCYVVNEWGVGLSLDLTLADSGPIEPRQAAWITAEVGDTLAHAHAIGEAHGLINPENVLIDRLGQVRVIGFAVDAALRGLPVGNPQDDVSNLVAVLYAGLTGRWAGTVFSGVPAAPRDHGVLLRARQVQAGIPRPLDQLCDRVLGHDPRHHGRHVPPSARLVADEAAHFVGDATDLTEISQERPHPSTRAGSSAHDTVVRGHPPIPPAPPIPSPADIPTQASMPPIVDDHDRGLGPSGEPTSEQISDPSWLVPREDAPPAPSLPVPEPRPLFATDPEDGSPVRRLPLPDHDTAAAAAAAWQQGDSGAEEVASDWSWQDPDEEVPGRLWFRIAVLVGILALVLLAVVAVNQVTGDPGRQEEPKVASPGSESVGKEPVPVKIVKVSDLDPQSDTGEENPEFTPLAVDGDPTTAWRTLSYAQQFGPGGLKTGVGLVFDLGSVRTVAQVDARVLGGQTTAQLFVTKREPSDVEGLTPLGRQTALERLSFSPQPRPQGRYVVLWLTQLPEVEGKFRGQIAEVKVLAEP